MHPSIPRRQRARVATTTPTAMLSPGLRGGAIHQLGTSYRTEQRALLRDVGAKFTRLARRQTRSVAVLELRAFHSKDGVSRIRRAGWAESIPQGSQDCARDKHHRARCWCLPGCRYSERMSWY